MQLDFRWALLAAGTVTAFIFLFALFGLFAPELLGWRAETAALTKVILVLLLISPRFLFYPVWQLHRQMLRSSRNAVR